MTGRSKPYPEDMPAPAAVGAAVEGASRIELTVVVPTFNERTNVPLLVERLSAALAGIAWEVVFVDDDSPDLTGDTVRDIVRRDPRVRVIERIGRRGLSSATVEGVLSSAAPCFAVMDADLQHDETLLARMLVSLRDGRADLAVGSRYVAGGGAQNFSKKRLAASLLANGIARRLFRLDITDPMSGFFMIRRTAAEELAPSLSNQGFKLLVDMLATSRGRLRVAELPYVFRERQHGESKLDARSVLDFFALMLAKLTNDAVSFRFLMYCLVGLTGVFTHMAILTVAVDVAGMSFGPGQSVATVVAIVWNFVLNNAVTYRDQRLAGWAFLTGLLRFEVICAVGAISNVGVATWIYGYDPRWWLAGLAGALMGAAWNYLVSAAFVWRVR